MIVKNIWALIFLCLLFTSCRQAKYEFIQGKAQGTTYHITYENRTNKNYAIAIDSILKAFDKSLSIYDPTSIISRINDNESNVLVDSMFITVFKKSAEINRLSGGAFDITVGPIVKAWGFGVTPKAKHDSAYIDSLLQFVGMQNVKLEDHKVIKAFPGVKLDVNALAQGYSVDVVCAFFDRQKIKNYMVEIGGEVRGKGINPHRKWWHVGIDKPKEDQEAPGSDLQAVIRIKNKSVSTSGNYRKFYVENGVKYSHTINPKTGRPARNTLLSATVVAPDCITADALATTFMVLGVEKGKQLVANLKDIDVYFVYDNGKNGYGVFSTKEMEKIIVNQNK